MIPKPAYHEHEEFKNRLRKLEEIRELRIDPFPPKFSPTQTLEEIVKRYEKDALGDSHLAAEGKTTHAVIAGRLVLFRPMGKNIFGQMQEGTARLQVMFNKEHTHVVGLPESETSLKFLEKKCDLGDILGIEGHLFRTQRGELTLYAKTVTLLCKTLLPLPEKHAGLADKELRYRKRWLDLLSHPEVFQTFLKRSHIVSAIRCYFAENQFVEVETPTLQNAYGGANARPFTTSINALDKQEMFMRISLEIPLKQLIVGGMDRVYEMGKVFRNEGIDKNHNPEFTELEAYAAYWDYNDMMSFVEKLFEFVALELYQTTRIPHTMADGKEEIIDVKAPWKRITMSKSIQHYAKIDVDNLIREELAHYLINECELDSKHVMNMKRGQMIAALFEEKVEHHLIQPHHITDHPIETTPLCKPHRDKEAREKGLVERFESYILCHEVCNSYTELNDPVLQRELLEEQAEKRAAGDEEASPLDEDFIEAICQGMPPASGIGIGIDRLVMILTNSHSIRDVLFFPLMKRKEDS